MFWTRMAAVLLVFDMISCGDLGVRQEWMKGLAMGGAVDIICRAGSRLVQSS
jgi:hypothetical protein